MIGPQLWAGMVAEPPVRLPFVLEFWAELVTWLVIDAQAVMVPPRPQLDRVPFCFDLVSDLWGGTVR